MAIWMSVRLMSFRQVGPRSEPPCSGRLAARKPLKGPRRAPSGTGPVRYGNLLDDDGALHAGALVGLAVVAVGAGGVELVGHLLAGAVEVVLVGDGIGVDAGGDVVLVEDDVVGNALLLTNSTVSPLETVILLGCS